MPRQQPVQIDPYQFRPNPWPTRLPSRTRIRPAPSARWKQQVERHEQLQAESESKAQEFRALDVSYATTFGAAAESKVPDQQDSSLTHVQLTQQASLHKFQDLSPDQQILFQSVFQQISGVLDQVARSSAPTPAPATPPAAASVPGAPPAPAPADAGGAEKEMRHQISRWRRI